MSNDNTEKSLRGKSGQENLGEIVDSLKRKNYITNYEEDYRKGYTMHDEKQFHYQYMVEFADKECWILQSTTSVRSDRMNIHQWNSEHLKIINTNIKKSYIITPNALSEREQKNVNAYKKKIRQKQMYSSIDDILNQSELYTKVEKHALELADNKGRFYAKAGNNFEEWLVEILNNKENYIKWKNDDTLLTGYMFNYFVTIVNKIGLMKQTVIGMNATTNIPRLESHGMPKTDLLLTVSTFEGLKNFTFSCKRCTLDRVAVHEYSAKQFVEVLDIKEKDLIDAIYNFQSAGNKKNMKPEFVDVMNEKMKLYNNCLAKWVFSGTGNEIQRAKFLITYKSEEEEFALYEVGEYIAKLENNNVNGTFGTLFSWTYPSHGKGHRIQLKSRII